MATARDLLHRLARDLPRSPAEARLRFAEERRSRLLAHNTQRDLTPPSPSAYRSYGEGSWIVPPARITHPELITIGTGVTIHEHAWISVTPAVEGHTPDLRIGDGTLIDRLCHIACVGTIHIGAGVLIAERVLIGDTFHEYEDVTTPVIAQPIAAPEPVTIGDGAYLGLGAIVLPGVTVGAQAYVGTGALVTRDVAPATLVVGNPARPVRRHDPRTGTWLPVSE